ncbi:L-serine ammonia-lyase [Candidatus Brachybacter algidus]|uniref:L-serine ammonia-lyase n=1 Tax=Candidatus Brachybacter algidus TaxID=2982024 RepID=UPI001D957A19|nr:L-serine ammonia-lyase [Candidatus Brachybacter algidus]MBK6450344.1 L-serine ammonia-lyase [Candidatus Brachybacter algidus]
MESISIFDMLKIGVGPSSSHTLGPWRAAIRFMDELSVVHDVAAITRIDVNLYGSLSLTGAGHATDIAVVMGLRGCDPTSYPVENIGADIEEIKSSRKLKLADGHTIDFHWEENICFNRNFLSFHPNGISFSAFIGGEVITETYYSIGGGFVVQEARKNSKRNKSIFKTFPFPIQKGDELLAICKKENKRIHEIVLENERSVRSDAEIDAGIKAIWDVMLQSMYTGCHTEGVLPGGLNVLRRAFQMHEKLKGDQPYSGHEDWIQSIRATKVSFREILKWVSCFALAVNEVNASLGRIVTAPTNGSAGVIPAVLMHYLTIENQEGGFREIKEFMLVAGEIGSIFKKGATISAAMGGCQAEIGVSSAMAAGALCSLLGGSPEQILMASEIAMEHHLGLTCDPIGGLVQIPCIERNAMGAIKAINAAELALDGDASKAKVSLDNVIQTMWETAQDMNSKYKETSEGGLAVHVGMSDC